jgi:diaminohydroxyphosphoribosylaminopyrimidine deaminase/5-amino-6-(5-phosphoribosylamino)uracil reductase
MRLALRLAARGMGYTSPNPMVGAVVVRDGEVVGKGYHRQAGGHHAEIHALGDAGELARGAVLYVTLEPCNHQGRTPPCTEAILRSGLSRVVVGCRDPNPRVSGGGVAFLRGHGLQVVVGVLEERCRRLNEAFIKHVTTGLPLVVAKVAASFDGKIASCTGDSRWISNEASRRFVHRLRRTVDAILVGVGTVIADNPGLTSRLSGRKRRNPLRIILDTNLRTPLDSRVVTEADEALTLIATGPEPPRPRKMALERRGVEVLPLPLDGARVSLKALLRKLGRRDITSLMVEGGAKVHGAFFHAGLVDKIYFFFAPKIIGGNRAVPMVGGPGSERITGALGVRRVRLRRFGDDIMIEGYLEGSPLCPGDSEGISSAENNEKFSAVKQEAGYVHRPD